MSALKRKAVEPSLHRRVRVRRELSQELDPEPSEQSVYEESPNSDEEGSGSANSSELDNDSESSGSEEPEEAASISFGALIKAQASLANPGKRKSKETIEQDGDTWEDNEAVERKAGRRDRRDFNRSSKHAPTEVSSKKAVSRKREVVPVAKREYRDPRFETLDGPVDDIKIGRAYSFLDEYRDDEMKELKEAIKTTKDDDAKEKLKRTLLVMESKKKAQIRKDKQQEILDKHRKEEKELVKQGKQPFYLKKAEQKKRVLLGQYSELKGKQLDRVIERRRKKVEGKEKKKMPFARRGTDS